MSARLTLLIHIRENFPWEYRSSSPEVMENAINQASISINAGSDFLTYINLSTLLQKKIRMQRNIKQLQTKV